MKDKLVRQLTEVKLSRVFIIIIGFIGLIILSPFILHEFETPYSYYETYEDMVKDGAIKRGWVPVDFPSSASIIHEQHDIDINAVWIIFNANSSDVAKFTESFEPFNLKDYNERKLKKPGSRFWNIDKYYDKDLLTDVYKRMSISGNNEDYTYETEEYIAKICRKNNITTYYYWAKS